MILALGCGGGAGAPATDSCTTPSSGSVDGVELGAATPDDYAGRPTGFAPLRDGDGMVLIRGTQGASMLGFILRVSGSSAPSCLGQETIVADAGGARVTSASAPLSTYLQPDGTRLTHALWLPADYPAAFLVSVTAGDKLLARHLHLILAP